MTGMHHVPVLIHCVGKNKFHIYVMRTFALSIWDWLVEAAAGLNDA
jgi:methylglutamate dehydrogenase subunit D